MRQSLPCRFLPTSPRASRSRRRSVPVDPRQICVEHLEERTLLSATATLSFGNLTIQGDAGLNNLVLTETAGGSTFQVTNNGDDLGTFVVTGRISINMGDGGPRGARA